MLPSWFDMGTVASDSALTEHWLTCHSIVLRQDHCDNSNHRYFVRENADDPAQRTPGTAQDREKDT